MINYPDKKAELVALSHAIQTGVKYDQETGSQCGSPKHLRTGLNIAMCDHGALAKLLIAKGVFTEVEYVDALIEGLQNEKARYEATLESKLGVKVSLE